MASSSTTSSPTKFNAPVQDVDSSMLIKPSSPDLLLVILIHGFMGSGTTFESFPERLERMLSESVDNVVTECIVSPEYKTKGKLTAVVRTFSEWLTKLVLEKEAAYGSGDCTGKVKVVLCGHSMGGLVAADALIQFVQNRPDADAPLWPRIIACLGFDAPYLGVQPSVFGCNKQSTACATAKRPAAGASGLRETIGMGYTLVFLGSTMIDKFFSKEKAVATYASAMGHMEYLENLLDEEELSARLDTIVGYDKKMGVLFRTFYATLPANPPSFKDPRTFIILPKRKTRHADYFLAVPNCRASGEIEAHMGVFETRANDEYDQLASETSRMIKKAVMFTRGVVEAESSISGKLRTVFHTFCTCVLFLFLLLQHFCPATATQLCSTVLTLLYNSLLFVQTHI